MARTAAHATVDGHDLALSNQEKVLFPRDGYTKGDLIAYYRHVSRWMLPHLRERPLTLQRFPDGIDGESFFEKRAPRYTPAWIPTAPLAAHENSTEIPYILCNDEATLVWCANLATIVFHVWYSRMSAIASPDYALFDLDPWEGCTIATLARVAVALRDLLGEIGLQPLVKSSGGSGLHVVVPLKPVYSYDEVRQFAEIVARRLAAEHPDLTTLERAIARRPKGRVYLDYVQVGRGKTVVPAYSVRARDGAPVSMPLEWSEVEAMVRKRSAEPERALGAWTIRTAPARLEERGDLWSGTRWKPAALERAVKMAAKRWS